MKTEHKIYAAIVLLAVLAGAYWTTRKSGDEQLAKHSAVAASADLPNATVSKEDGDKITKIEIASPNKDDKTKLTKVTLEKKGDAWEVTAPVSAKANASNVKSVLENLHELKVKEVIDKGTGSYGQYELTDEKAVHFVAYKGAEKAADFYFGKSGGRGQLARLGGKDGVYVMAGYKGYLFAREIKNWRENSILKFEDANAIQVEVTNKNGRMSFSKNGDKWSASLTKRDKDGALEKKPEKEWKKFEESKVKDLLRAYKALSAEDFGEDKDKAEAGLDKAEENGGVLKIVLKDNAGEIIMKVGKVQKGTSRWVMKEGDATLYAISSWAAEWAYGAPTKFEKGDDKKDKPAAPAHDDHHDDE